MRVIIAGGRDFKPEDKHLWALDRAKHEFGITAVLEGGASGADGAARGWAHRNALPCKTFHAEWNKYGKQAGPLRNKQMAREGQALIVFPGGRGTRNMIMQALERGLPILKIDQEGNWDTTDWRAEG